MVAAWQSAMGGGVVAGGVFATLQSWGMLYSVTIPVVGVVMTAGSVVASTVKYFL